MKLSYNLLKSWLKFKATPEELVSLIDLHITEVESLTKLSQFEGVVVGKILEITPHPNADKLRKTVVDIGSTKLNIVCGARNIEVGQLVPVATVGCSLPNGLTIAQASIRGEDSFGMLCSEEELGLKDTSEGILILDSKVTVGSTLDEALDLTPDYSIEIKVLSNRPDYTSYFSFARELAAVLKTPFEPPLGLDYPEAKLKTRDYLKVAIKDKEACSRYVARVVRNIKVKPSPAWLKSALKASGIRSINNIVDISNYCMLESGHPIHIFDYNRLDSTEIVVRFAKSGEELLCLDGVNRRLTPQTVVIADLKHPVAIAGIMGGERSGVNEETIDIVIEVANFDRLNIRKTARALGIRTDASTRFERGVDILDSENVMARVLHLIHEDLEDADIFAGNIDIHDKLPAAEHLLKVPAGEVTKLIGLDISGSDMAELLTRLNLATQFVGEYLEVRVPHYRQDLEGIEDIAEEILRLHGSDKIPSVLPGFAGGSLEMPPTMPLIGVLKRELLALGAAEIQSHAFETASKGAVELMNPLNENWTHLKTDLLPHLLKLDIDRKHFVIFEINTIFAAQKSGLPIESKQLAVRVTGKDSYREARGILDCLIERFGFAIKTQELSDGSGLSLHHSKDSVGRIIVHGKDSAGFTLNLTLLVETASFVTKHVEAGRFPSIKMDMAFAVKPATRVGDMMGSIYKIDKLITTVELFDDFQMADNERSVAFHIELKSSDKTLSSEIRDEIHSRIKAEIAKTFHGKLRE